MKILYDITILGHGHADSRQRTGIFRVIEDVAKELILLPELDIRLCTNSLWRDIQLCKNYIDSQNCFTQNSFSEPLNYTKRVLLKNKLRVLLEDYGEDWNHLPFIKKTKARLKNKNLEIREHLLSKGEKRLLINPNDLRKADIYHAHFDASFNGIIEGGVKKLFLTIYDLIPILLPQFCDDGMGNRMLRTLNQLTPEHWIVCISEATRNDLLNYMGKRIDPDKVKVTELAASHLFYQSTDKYLNQLVRHKYGIPDAPYVLSLCTLEPRKNIDQAIRAFVQLVQQENVPDLNLVLVGAKGWKSQKIFDAIDASDAIKQRIYITGYMADEDLAAMYSDALMFVYPSFYEGFGLPPLEAMQCGVPVITSNTSSLPEVIGDAGIMVPPTDLDALCQAMLSVYKSPAVRQQMIQQSLDRARLFSWKKCAEKTADAYKTSLQS